MSSGGPATASTNTSPRVAGPTTTRRRVADNNVNNNNDTEKQQQQSFPDSSELEQDNDPVSSLLNLNHHAHVHHHLHPITRYFLLRARIFIEHFLLTLSGSVQWFRSGKNVGRKIFAVLIMLVVMSVFFKVSLFIGGGVEMNGKKSIENGQLILQRFKEDWASAQRVVTEESSETSMPKRVLERLAVSDYFFIHYSRFAKSAFYFFFTCRLKILFRESVFLFLLLFSFYRYKVEKVKSVKNYFCE